MAEKEPLYLVTQNIGLPYSYIFRLPLTAIKWLNHGGRLPNKSLEKLITTIKGQEGSEFTEPVDVISLQEVRKDHLETLEKVLKGYKRSLGGCTQSGDHRVTYVRDYLAEDSVAEDSGVPISARYKNKDVPTAIATYVNGVWVVNVHFDCANRKLNKTQLQEVLDYCSNVTEKAIIMGDFNTSPKKMPHDLLQKKGFREVSEHITKTFSLLGVITGKYDYIITNLDPDQHEQCSVVDYRAHPLQDHLAVKAKLLVPSSSNI